jgi:hypothetical protein
MAKKSEEFSPSVLEKGAAITCSGSRIVATRQRLSEATSALFRSGSRKRVSSAYGNIGINNRSFQFRSQESDRALADRSRKLCSLERAAQSPLRSLGGHGDVEFNFVHQRLDRPDLAIALKRF